MKKYPTMGRIMAMAYVNAIVTSPYGPTINSWTISIGIMAFTTLVTHGFRYSPNTISSRKSTLTPAPNFPTNAYIKYKIQARTGMPAMGCIDHFPIKAATRLSFAASMVTTSATILSTILSLSMFRI